MNNSVELTVNVGIDVSDSDAAFCAKILEVYLSKHKDKHLDIVKRDDGGTNVFLMKDC